MTASKILFAGLFAALMVGSQAAKADGFVCRDNSGTYGIKLYDNVTPRLGTRVPAIMVLSDGSLASGSKTLATFSQAAGNLHYVDGSYHAEVSFPAAYTQTLGGVKMSQINELVFLVNHNFNQALAMNQNVVAQLQILDKSHNIAYVNFTCARYLKN